MNTSIPGYAVNFQANLPVASQMTVSRPGWPVHINTSKKGISE
jgi:hypothetical protein